MNTQLTTTLALNPLFGKLPDESQDKLVNIGRIKRYTNGEFVFRKNDVAEGLLGVINGELRIGGTNFHGEQLVFTVLSQGDWFGELSVLDGKGRTHDAYCVGDTSIALLPLHPLQKLMRSDPAIYQALVDLACGHCRAAYSGIDDFLLLTPQARTAQRLINASHHNKQSININQEELAKLVGVSRQTINKFLKAWEKEGAIERRYGFIELLDQHRLQELAAG